MGLATYAQGTPNPRYEQLSTQAPERFTQCADGPQTLAQLRLQDALVHVPVVFLTAHTQASQVARFRDMGAADVIAKPFDPQGLCDRIAKALSGTWQMTMLQYERR